VRAADHAGARDPGGERSAAARRAFGDDHFLRLAIDITVAVGKASSARLLHKDIKPSKS